MTETTNSTDTRAVVERYVAAVEAGDAATVRAIIGEFLAGALGRYEPGSVRGGKIQAVREYMDTAYAARMLFGGERAAA